MADAAAAASSSSANLKLFSVVLSETCVQAVTGLSSSSSSITIIELLADRVGTVGSSADVDRGSGSPAEAPSLGGATAVGREGSGRHERNSTGCAAATSKEAGGGECVEGGGRAPTTTTAGVVGPSGLKGKNKTISIKVINKIR